ncbi:MAG: hypothetical protein DLM73_07375 [Chthoniobacterales bacterium]|nr:MAG: hypothetical protein DLM73_07375 [Chthoniobacterales bacterium]
MICGIVFGAILLRERVPPQREAGPQTTATPSAAVVEPPASPPVETTTAPTEPTPSEKEAPLFSYKFESTARIAQPLFDSRIMSVLNANGEGQIIGKSAGILPAMFDTVILDDFIVECGMRAETVPPGASYGFIFRAADVVNGGIAKYYALLLDPNNHVARLSWWMDGRWMMNPEQTLPAGLLRVGRKNRVTLEAKRKRFRVFIDGKFAAEFSMEGLNEGRIGLCLAGVDSKPWTVHFDNFQIFPAPTDPSDAFSLADPPASTGLRRDARGL